MTKKPFLKEACVETLKEAVFAYNNGADWLEICYDLDNDGLTPSSQLIKDILAAVKMSVKVMIRPRSGNFDYSAEDLIQIKADIQMCHQLNIKNIVFGCVKNGHLDIKTLNIVCQWAKGMRITFHKAIDTITNPIDAILEIKKHSSIEAILSSGQKETALDGVTNLLKMKEVCADDLILIPAGKITATNIYDLHKRLNLKHYHGRRIV